MARYVSKRYQNDENKDTVDDVYTSYDPYFVADLKLSYKITKFATVSFSVDNIFDTFGDKPQCLSLGNQSRKPEGLKWLKGLVALSVNTEDTPLGTRIYRKQTPMLAIGVYECVDKDYFANHRAPGRKWFAELTLRF